MANEPLIYTTAACGKFEPNDPLLDQRCEYIDAFGQRRKQRGAFRWAMAIVPAA